MIKVTLVVRGMHYKKQFLKSSPVDNCNQVPKEGKDLDNHVDASIKYLNKNKE